MVLLKWRTLGKELQWLFQMENTGGLCTENDSGGLQMENVSGGQ